MVLGPLVAERLAQIGERLTQVVAGIVIGLIGPQQPRQRIARVRASGFERQVGQQRAHLLRLEAGHWHAIERCLGSPEQRQ